MKQLMLFSEPLEQRIDDDLDLIREDMGKLRRALFKRVGDLSKEVQDIKLALEALDHKLWVLEGYAKSKVFDKSA